MLNAIERRVLVLHHSKISEFIQQEVQIYRLPDAMVLQDTHG